MERQMVRGCCPLDCQDRCAWVAEVENGRVVRVRGAKDHPFTRGVLCTKVNDYQDRTYAPDRLLYPMRRTGPKGSGQFGKISWDEALDEIAARFRAIIGEHGPAALMTNRYAGAMGVLQLQSLLRVFNGLGATRQVGNICGGAEGAGLAEMGHDLMLDPEMVVHARMVILWGSNLLSTCHHYCHFIQQARRKNGARVIAIDVRPTQTTARADQYIPIRPNTDLALALALGHVILSEGLEDREFLAEHATGLEEYRRNALDWPPERAAAVTGVPAERIRTLARALAAAKPAAIKAGVIPSAHSGGAEMARAIAALPILCGHWRLPGGGLFNGANPGANSARAAGVHLAPPGVRTLTMGSLGENLTSESLTPPVLGLMVWGTNPMLVQPDLERVRQGLLREDLFTVVLEHFLTDTARYADILLPSTTQLEHFDVLSSWGTLYMTVNHPAIAPLGESRSHSWVARQLSRRLGLPEYSDEEIIQDFLPAGVSLDHLKEQGWVKVEHQRPIPTVRLDFTPVLPPQPSETYPLALVSPKSHHTLNSSFMNQPRHRAAEGDPTLLMHTDDAAARGLAEGVWARIYNARGAVYGRVQVTREMLPGTVVLAGRWWADPGKRQVPVNLLVPGQVTKGGQPVYNECAVQVEAAVSSPS